MFNLFMFNVVNVQFVLYKMVNFMSVSKVVFLVVTVDFV